MEKLRASAPLVLALMLLLFAGGLFWGYQAMVTPRAEPTTPKPTCVPQTADDVVPSMVTVNVYNVDSKAGHAGEVAQLLAAAGFIINQIGNDSHPVLGQVVVLGAAMDAPEVLLVAGFFPEDGVEIQADGRADHSVDIYITDTLEALHPEPPASIDVQGDSVCLPYITPSPITPPEGEDAQAPDATTDAEGEA